MKNLNAKQKAAQEEVAKYKGELKSAPDEFSRVGAAYNLQRAARKLVQLMEEGM